MTYTDKDAIAQRPPHLEDVPSDAVTPLRFVWRMRNVKYKDTLPVGYSTTLKNGEHVRVVASVIVPGGMWDEDDHEGDTQHYLLVWTN